LRAEQQQAAEPRDEEEKAQCIEDELLQWLERDEKEYTHDRHHSASHHRPKTGRSSSRRDRDIKDRHLDRGEGSSASRSVKREQENGKFRQDLPTVNSITLD
jgi:hypothetical protein